MNLTVLTAVTHCRNTVQTDLSLSAMMISYVKSLTSSPKPYGATWGPWWEWEEGGTQRKVPWCLTSNNTSSVCSDKSYNLRRNDFRFKGSRVPTEWNANAFFLPLCDPEFRSPFSVSSLHFPHVKLDYLCPMLLLILTLCPKSFSLISSWSKPTHVGRLRSKVVSNRNNKILHSEQVLSTSYVPGTSTFYLFYLCSRSTDMNETIIPFYRWGQ